MLEIEYQFWDLEKKVWFLKKECIQTLEAFQLNMADSSNPQSAEEAAEVPKNVSKIKHDWYQTESHVVITILAKNVKEDGVKVEFGDETVSFSSSLMLMQDTS